MIGFNIFNPFSIFRRIAVFGSLGGSIIATVFNLKEDMGELAKKDAGPLGDLAWKLPWHTIARGVTYLYWVPVIAIPRLRAW